MSARSRCGALLLALLPGAASAGAFIFAGEGDPDSITHPSAYTGAGGARTVNVCLRTAVLPAGVSAATVENTVRKAVATWNAQRVAASNIGLNSNNDIPSGGLDFESVLLHELGHCLGLAHVNHASESGFSDDRIDGTKSGDGANNVLDQAAGPDGLHGSSDDVRGDDVNLYWYRSGSNDPLAFPAIIDQTTFQVPLSGLPGGHTFARNADRDVLASMGVPDTESVMQQGQFSDEAQRRLTAEDMATIRLGMAGRDQIQGTSDDYTFQLVYLGQQQNCDTTVEFNTDSSFAFCSVGGAGIGNGHFRIAGAELHFSPTVNWFFSPQPNTITTITSDSPDPSDPGESYAVGVTVTTRPSTVTGTPTGQVEVRDDLGASCVATLASGSGTCSLASTGAGARTLTATYLGFRGFDASASAGVAHAVTGHPSILTLSESPSSTVIGQSYTVSATVSGSAGTPTGTVAVDDGNGRSCTITLAAGIGSCSISSLVTGTLTLSGTYSGDAAYTGDDDTESHIVNAASTTTTIVSDTPTSTVVGQSYTVSVNVAVVSPGIGVPTGTVTIGDGQGQSCNAVLAAGSGSCALASNASGNLTLSANYPGGGGLGASSDTEPHTVTNASTTTTITSDTPASTGIGENYTVAVTVAPVAPGAGVPTGSVTIADGAGRNCNAVLASGSGSCTLASIVAGTLTLTASYPGAGGFNASSDTEPHAVRAASQLAIASVLPEPSAPASAATVTISVVTAPNLPAPSGTIAVSTDREAATCNIVLPATSCALTLTAEGTHEIRASYPGDANYVAAQAQRDHVVALPVRVFRDGFE